MPLKLSDPTKEVSVLNRWATDIEKTVSGQQKELVRLNKQLNTVAPATPTGQLAATLPPVITNLSATESGSTVNGQTFSTVTVGYTAPNPLGTFHGVYAVVQNYNGSSSLVKVAEHTYTGAAGGGAAFSFTLNTTEETIILYAVAKNAAGGTVTDWTTAPHVNVVLDGKTADLSTNDIKNGHASAVPAPTNPATIFSYAAGDGGSLSPAINITWPSFSIVKPDGSSIAIPASASDAIPPLSTLGQIPGGVRALTTLHARTAYFKNNQLRGISADQSLAVAANNLLTLTSPPTPSPNIYDGWMPLVGSVARPQLSTPLPFGTDYVEPVGHFVTTYPTYTSWNSQTGAVSYMDDAAAILAYSSNYFYFPYYLISDTALYFKNGGHLAASANFTNDGTAIFLDGQYPLTGVSGIKAITSAAAGSGSGSGGVTCPIKGTSIIPIGFECLAIDVPNKDWITIRTTADFELTASRSHCVVVDGNKKSLSSLHVGDYVDTTSGSQRITYKRMYSEDGIALKVEMAEGHTYWANGILSHNMKSQ
jgi:hypothetical protein